MNLKQSTKIVEKVQNNLKKLTNNRGKHDQWSIKDVPMKLLRKPTNFAFLYNSNAMSSYYNRKIIDQDMKKLNVIHTSFENINEFRKSTDSLGRKFITIDNKSPRFANSSFETRGTPVMTQQWLEKDGSLIMKPSSVYGMHKNMMIK